MKLFSGRIFSKFQTKVTIALIAAMLFAGALNNLLVYRYALKVKFNDLRNTLMMLADAAARSVDPKLILATPSDVTGPMSEGIAKTVATLKQFKSINPSITYLYVMKKTAQEGVWEFVLDVDLQEGKPYSRKNLSRPGDKYNAARFPQMLKGYFEPTADLKLERDEWGLSLSGYAPIRDSAGNAVAVLGMDIMAADVYAMQQEVHRRATFVLLLSGFICVLIGFVIARMITNPVGRLIEGTRHISGGELGYQIEVKGKDEISELAKSFNLMAQSLQDSRRKLLDYFYQVVRSLVLVLEAKDHYTRGHSERVADYAGKTALKMGLPQDKAEMLKEAAMLHDVGKMGVPEEVLNKKEKLSEQEWEVIRKHPLLGEEILKPVLLNPELLEMVRGHHERYDGTGYPDKLRAGDINIYAAIVSVADAYDAMTSERAYRKAMSRAEAIEELKRNSASQFNPKVVQAFLRVLDEEKKY